MSFLDFCFWINVSHFSVMTQNTNLRKSYNNCEILHVVNRIFFITVEPRYKEVGYNKTLL